jgi:serine/threonine-protein kinase
MSDFATRLQDALGAVYQIDRELPLGGLGRLFLATEVASGRQVSVQALPPDLAERVDLGRFRAAVDRVSRLRHPGLLPLLAVGARQDVVYCVWPHPRGESLRYRLIRDGGLGADETVQVLHDVADALAYGHVEGVYHGDLRPDNIYLENGRAFIAEFGIRSALNAALGSEGGMDTQADVHALAVAGQQMVSGRSGRIGAVIGRALSIDPAEQFADAAAFRDAVGAPPSAQRRRRHWRVAGAGLALTAVVLTVGQLVRGRGALDPDLMAIAPFEVLDPEHSVWREGLVTILAANLDGAGPLHTVSPSVVVRRWSGRADAASATALAHRTGARLTLFGSVVRAGGDTMQLRAVLLDVETGATLADLQLTRPDGRLDLLADSLSVQLLRELSTSRAIGAVRRASLGTASLPALKAFLEGEQRYRRSEWDQALDNYRHAIGLDSTFALALYRAGLVLGWQGASGDSLSTDYLTRAAAHNHGLPPRDSMLVVAESLTAALDEHPDQPGYWPLYRRLYATTAEAARRYPRDPEVWYEYGDVRYHFPVFSNIQEIRDAFDRSIGLDSAFAPAYIHPIELAPRQGDDVAGARHYLDRYLAVGSRDSYADAMRLTRRLLDPRQARSAGVQRVLDTASSDLLIAAIQVFHGWSDSLETSVRLGRLLAEGRPGTVLEHTAAAVFVPEFGLALAYHGRLREAYAAAGRQVKWVLAATAWMGGVPADSATAAFGRSLRGDTLYPRALAAIGAPWYAQRRDSVSLKELARRADSTSRASPKGMERMFARYVGDGARALQALVRGDTSAAIAGLMALPDTACLRCALYTAQLAQLLDAQRRDEAAAILLARDPPLFSTFSFPTDGFWQLYRARLAVRRGDRRAASLSYRFVVAVWLHGDEVLQPYVREAREYLARSNERD